MAYRDNIWFTKSVQAMYRYIQINNTCTYIIYIRKYYNYSTLLGIIFFYNIIS